MPEKVNLCPQDRIFRSWELLPSTAHLACYSSRTLTGTFPFNADIHCTYVPVAVILLGVCVCVCVEGDERGYGVGGGGGISFL